MDSLAIAIGTSHGAFKFKPGQKPQLRFDILEEITKRLPDFPIVLHGASSVSREYVKIIQENGGELADAIGIPEDMLRRAAKSAVCKINIDSDLRLAMTAGVRQVLVQKPSAFDPREYLKALRMERAATLLLRTDQPVSTIAASVGFSNPFQFSAMFKKYFGLSPAAYRKEG